MGFFYGRNGYEIAGISEFDSGSEVPILMQAKQLYGASMHCTYTTQYTVPYTPRDMALMLPFETGTGP